MYKNWSLNIAKSAIKKAGPLFFKYRDVLPVPLAALLIYRSKPKGLNFLLGFFFILVGELLRIWALRHIGPTTRTRTICADFLVTSGPYKYSRNPIYFANLIKVVGFIISSGDLLCGIYVLLFYSFEFLALINFEESYLARRFPIQFNRYKKIVPVFFPTGKVFDDKSTPSWKLEQAIWSERRTFLSTGLLLFVLIGKTFLGNRFKEHC
ncbi:MAG: isoprenylcysteine carboxylmethyltransferase family protein [Candidatus Riflebacteria bacterium]|nr:isoprenylcysteine carboxylmethyltransferase family protein [Candidatus Riflebacteria bacterium]